MGRKAGTEDALGGMAAKVNLVFPPLRPAVCMALGYTVFGKGEILCSRYSDPPRVHALPICLHGHPESCWQYSVGGCNKMNIFA